MVNGFRERRSLEGSLMPCVELGHMLEATEQSTVRLQLLTVSTAMWYTASREDQERNH